MTPNTDIGNELQELINQGDLNAIVISVNVTPKTEETPEIYVPQEIGLTPLISRVRSIGIVNYEGQELFNAQPNIETYNVHPGISNNTGSNYYLKEVEEPQPGEVYFITDEDEIFSSDLGTLSKYKLYLTPDDYCMWDEVESRGVGVDSYTWNHYYEVRYGGED